MSPVEQGSGELTWGAPKLSHRHRWEVGAALLGDERARRVAVELARIVAPGGRLVFRHYEPDARAFMEARDGMFTIEVHGCTAVHPPETPLE